MRSSFKLLVFSLAPCCAGSLPAQVSAALSGAVTDASGGVVAAAAVAAKSRDTGMVRGTVADAAGRYRIPSLPVGEYEIRAGKPGFSDAVRTGVHLVVGEDAKVDFSLRVGEHRQQVTVNADAGLVDVTTRDISGLEDERQVRDLPLNGRSYDELLTLNPGVVNFTSAEWERATKLRLPTPSVGSLGPDRVFLPLAFSKSLEETARCGERQSR